MSIRVMTLVWERSQHAGSHLLMMLALADFSDDHGCSYPAVSTLAAKCRMKPRNANVVLAALRDSGELQVLMNAGPNGVNRYRILLKALDGVQTNAGLQSVAGLQCNAGDASGDTLQGNAGTPARACSKPLQPVAAEPSLNRQEPSSKSQHGRKAPAPRAVIDLPDWIPSQAWSDFVAMRKSLRKPLTQAAMHLQVKMLEKLRGEGHDPGAVLEQSIAASWQGLFAVKADQRKPDLWAGAI